MIEPALRPETAFSQVEVAAVGPISLAALDELREVLRAEQVNVERMARDTVALSAEAEDRLADVGAHLVPYRESWHAPADLWPWLDGADELVDRIRTLDARIAQAGATRSPLSSVRVGALRRQRAGAARQLREALMTIARAGTKAALEVPGVASLVQEGAALERRAIQAQEVLETAQHRLDALHEEVRLREDAALHMGFDSLHIVAYAERHGLPTITSPVELAPGEVAHLAFDAALTRMAGAMSPGTGLSVQFAHTGIRYWVGTFEDRPAPVNAQDWVDAGALVLSNRRLVFTGSGSLQIPLDVVVDLTAYTDGLAIWQLGRDSPELFLASAPRQLALYINLALAADARR